MGTIYTTQNWYFLAEGQGDIVSECTPLYVCIYSVKRSEKVKIIIPIDYNNNYYCDQLAISTNRWDGTCHL